MITSITTVQGLKALLGTGLVGIGLDAAASRLGPFLWFLAREILSLLLWGLLAGRGQFLIPSFPPAGCPLELLATVTPILGVLARAV